MFTRKKILCWLAGILCCVAMLSPHAIKGTAECASRFADADTNNAVRVPIVMYHTVLKNTPGKYTVTPQTLENDFKYLNNNGYTSIHISDLINYKELGTPLPEKPIIITFDDGNRSNYIHTFRLMKEYQMKCVFSVVGEYTDSNYDKSGKRIASAAAYLTYEQINEMSESGFAEFQNHSYAMHGLGKRRGMNKKSGESTEQYESILAADLKKLNDALKSKTQIECTAVTFPFGSYCNSTITVAKSLGFKAALTCTEGVNFITRDSDLFELKRYNRPQSISTDAFFGKIEKSGRTQ